MTGTRASSLALRLFLSAAAWMVAILIATGIILSSIYHDAVERSFDRRLSVYLQTLVAEVAAPELSGDRGAPALSEPKWEYALSGWYWQITVLDGGKPEIRASPSLQEIELPRLRDEDATTSPNGDRHGYAILKIAPEEQRLRLIERTLDLGDDGRYLIAVAGDPQEEIDDEMRAFDRALLVTFGTLAAVLLVITMFQVRFGLAPLKRISEALAAIRAGTAERLEGRFPVEIAPLARETNALIDANREIVERARTHVGNLAHALKTPLSVVVNEAAGRDDPLADKVTEQANIMRDQIARHLERARLAAGLKVVASVTSVVPVVAALTRTMEKIHQSRGIAIDLDAPAEVRFRGERQDLEEMVGNLVDNACKWAQMRVSVEVVAERRDGAATVRIIIDDDGPGLNPAQRDQVARRGLRLDETKPGSGLGLSIVLELAALYGGNLQLGNAPIGGLRTELVLPAV
jgi:signal transduction histidine kinase